MINMNFIGLSKEDIAKIDIRNEDFLEHIDYYLTHYCAHSYSLHELMLKVLKNEQIKWNIDLKCSFAYALSKVHPLDKKEKMDYSINTAIYHMSQNHKSDPECEFFNHKLIKNQAKIHELHLGVRKRCFLIINHRANNLMHVVIH